MSVGVPVVQLDDCERTKAVRSWNGQKVVILGAGRQGIALARFFVQRGAHVLLNDRLHEVDLRGAQKALADQPVEWIAGGHPLSILEGADLMCVSGGIPLDLPVVIEAHRKGIPLSNDSQIFLETALCQVIGITGSAGKTTTTTLVGRIAKVATERLGSESKVWIGGNIGNPLIANIDEIGADDIAIMELSSFQLELMTNSPQIAAVLNITPNHLDRHQSMEAYRAAKKRIIAFQCPEDLAVLNRDDPGAWSLKDELHGGLVSFGLQPLVPGEIGTFLSKDGSSIILQAPIFGSEHRETIMTREDIALRGEHNLVDVLAACAVAYAAGLPFEAMLEGVRGFRGVPHRLEFVRNWRGAAWYNDSIATAPERSIAAIKSFDEPLILLAGGRDKNLPWESFAALVHRRVKHLILFGEAADKIAQAMLSSPVSSKINITHCADLREAVQAAAEVVAPGDVVLLSPGGTSFDEFHDFEDRGEAFKRWVMELP